MKKVELHIITPVKNSFHTAQKTFDSIARSAKNINKVYTVYDDFSDTQTAEQLLDTAHKYGFRLLNLAQFTTHPSPNYHLVLQMAQRDALADNAHLLIVESDVVLPPDTIQALFDYASQLENPGLIAAVTVNQAGDVNFPYHYARRYPKGTLRTKKRLSFCCTLLTNPFLQSFDFANLDPSKSWFDVRISQEAKRKGFRNYLITSLPVVHLPHSSRPWKNLKYSNPIKYYWHKFVHGLDKI